MARKTVESNLLGETVELKGDWTNCNPEVLAQTKANPRTPWETLLAAGSATVRAVWVDSEGTLYLAMMLPGGELLELPAKWLRVKLEPATPKLEETATQAMFDALMVIQSNPEIAFWMDEHDPKAFEQVRAAIKLAQTAKVTPA